MCEGGTVSDYRVGLPLIVRNPQGPAGESSGLISDLLAEPQSNERSGEIMRGQHEPTLGAGKTLNESILFP